METELKVCPRYTMLYFKTFKNSVKNCVGRDANYYIEITLEKKMSVRQILNTINDY